MSVVTTTDPRFQAQLDALTQGAETQGEAVQLTGTRRAWNTPDLNGWSGDPLDIPNLDQPFDRGDLEDQYETALETAGQRDIDGNTSGGTLADRMVVKLQGDYLGDLERSYRAQAASSVRCAFHAAARRLGHGHDQGPIQNAAAHILALIQAGTVQS
jgi:hypothetical protein